MTSHSLAKAKRRRFTPIALTTGVVAAALLSVSMTGTLSGFVASITNSTNTTATGALVMQETQTISGTTTTCLSTDGGSINSNTSTCLINKFGGTTNRLIPGATTTQTITITNNGTVTPTSFTLNGGTCTQTTAGTPSGSATNLCTKINLVITQGSQTVYSGTAATMGTTLRTITASASPTTPLVFTIAVTLDSSADNTYQNLQASMPLVWTYNA